jgi:probable rRNA maturation factor
VITVEIANRSGLEVDQAGADELTRRLLAAEGIEEAELGLAFVGAQEMRMLKQEHLGIDEATDVLSFPLDGRDVLPAGVPRALGDVILCPQVVGAEWRRPLAHGLLHLLGYEHGSEMEARERGYAR